VTTRIRIQTPSASGEAAGALQAVNRRRLEQREEDDRIFRDATRRIRQQTTRTQSDRDRAVPEFDPIEPVFAKRLGKAFDVAAAWWRYDQDFFSSDKYVFHWITVSNGDRSQTVQIDLPPLDASLTDAHGQSVGLIWWHCLPAGKDKAMIVFYIQTIDATATPVGSVTPDPTEESFPPNPAPGDFFTYIIEDTSSTEYSNPQVQAIMKAAIVSPTGINVVDCPEPMATATARIYTYITDASISNSYVDLGFRKTTVYIAQALGDDPTDVRWYELGFTYEAIPQLESVINVTYANENKWDRDRFVWLYLLRAYGYGRLVDRNLRAVGYEQDPGWGWTPAFFSYLKNYEGEFHVQDDDPSLDDFRADAANYKRIRERYFPADAPPFLLTSGFQSEEATAAGIDTTADYWYFRAPGADTASSVTTADFNLSALLELGIQLQRNGGAIKREPVSSNLATTGFSGLNDLDLSQSVQDGGILNWIDGREVPVIAWDWGRPLACWLQLTQLGFTASDLMLSDEEAQALAAADPTTDGFKF